MRCSLNKILGDIEIPPLEACDKIIANKKIKPIQTINKNVLREIEVSNWKELKYSDIFKIENYKYSNATELLEDGNDIYYVGTKKIR